VGVEQDHGKAPIFLSGWAVFSGLRLFDIIAPIGCPNAADLKGIFFSAEAFNGKLP
jgi:hypothetical protein